MGEEALLHAPLSYHDVYLYAEDASLVLGAHWWNDQVIAFAFEWLKFQVPCPSPIVAIPAAACFLLLHSDAQTVREQLEQMQVHAASGLLLAVNDSTSLESAGGGTHWSLLAVALDQGSAWHVDSLGGANRRVAQALTRKLAAGLDRHLALHPAPAAPQQTNGYDCGACTVSAAQALWRCPVADWRPPLRCLQRAAGAQAMRREVAAWVRLAVGGTLEKE
ncbi:hypothetical protein ACKKBF_B20410 [Auxenochlorella protothecoides x Auxenochlorella symbiontica]